jgi:GT2 family glycosyltransferase
MSPAIARFFDEVLIILVVYRCRPEASATWVSLVKEAAAYRHPINLYLCDNTPEPQDFPASPFLNMKYQHNPHNPGVSRVYNDGCAIARGQKKKWLLLLDQDTSLGERWLEKYFHCILKRPNSPVNVPILFSGDILISPFRYWATRGFPDSTLQPGVYSLKKYFALNSGLLVDREIFEFLGGYDESIPLYFSDFAFMRKLRENNYHLQVIDLRGQHGLSALEKQDLASAAARFRQYCLGSKRLTRYTHQSFLHLLIAAGRAIRLGIRHRSLNFIVLLFQSWVTA